MRGTWQTTDSGRGGLILIVIIAAAVLGSGAASAVASAVVTIAITLAVVLGLAVAAVAGVLIWRARSDRPGRPIPAPVVYQLPPEQGPQLSETSKAALEPPREIHLHLNVSPDQLAVIMRHYTKGE